MLSFKDRTIWRNKQIYSVFCIKYSEHLNHTNCAYLSFQELSAGFESGLELLSKEINFMTASKIAHVC